MSNLIQIKRSTANSTVTGLQAGELAFTQAGNTFFIGAPDGTSGSIRIGGQMVPGTLTANQALVANSTSGIDKVIVANLVANSIWANGAAGTSGDVLTSNGTAIFWKAPSVGVAGSNTQIQFNDGGNLAGDAGLTFNKTTDTLSTNNVLATSTVNAATLSVGTSVVANSSRLVIGTAVGLQVNGTIGTAGQILYSNGTTGYWAAAPTGDITAVTAGNGLTGGSTSGDATLDVGAGNGISVSTDAIAVLANSGLVANATGLHIVTSGDTTLIANATGLYVNDATLSIATSQLTGDVALGTQTSGNYVATITAGAGISGSSSTEGGTPTIAVVANNGIVANSTGVFVAAANGVSVTAAGVNVLAGTNGGLVSNSTGVFVTAGSGLLTNATGVHVGTGNGVAVDADVIRVVAGTAGGLVSNSTGVFVTAGSGLLTNATGVHVGTGNGVAVDADAVRVVAGTGVTVNATGVHIGQAVATTSNVTFANVVTSNISVTGTVSSNLMPLANNTYHLGNTLIKWAQVHAANVHGVTGIFDGNVEIAGDLIVSGNVTTTNVGSLVVADAKILLAANNPGDILDIGFSGTYTDGGSTVRHAGLFRDASDNGVFKFFANTVQDLTGNNVINTTSVGYTTGILDTFLRSSGLTTNSSVTNITANSTVSVSIVANTLTLSTALAGTSGGTGRTTSTNNALLVGNSTNGYNLLTLGTTGQVLQSNGTALVYDTLDGGTF
jgi:hypothetical protein